MRHRHALFKGHRFPNLAVPSSAGAALPRTQLGILLLVWSNKPFNLFTGRRIWSTSWEAEHAQGAQGSALQIFPIKAKCWDDQSFANHEAGA